MHEPIPMHQHESYTALNDCIGTVRKSFHRLNVTGNMLQYYRPHPITSLCTYKHYIPSPLLHPFHLHPHTHPWLLSPSLWVFHGLLCLMDGLKGIQRLIEEEGGVVNQHVQVAIEGRVLPLITGGGGGGRGMREVWQTTLGIVELSNVAQYLKDH